MIDFFNRQSLSATAKKTAICADAGIEVSCDNYKKDWMFMVESQGKMLRAARVTQREREVLQLVIQGFTNKDIARRLGISDYTARDHVSSLLRKTGVKNRAQLIASYLPAPRKNLKI